jgi:hypothetical protein
LREECLLGIVGNGTGVQMTPRQESTFFAALRLANGTFKTTADRRMDDLNECVLARWRETAFRPTEIMDVGVSSGITTAEWVEALSRAGFLVRMTATDLTLWGDIVQLWPGVSVLEAGGHILQHRVFGVPIRPWRRRVDYVTGYALLTALANGAAARRRLRSKHVPKRVLLVSPRAQQHAAIEWIEDDVLGHNPAQFIRRFDAIRAANILNRDYFNADQLQRAVANLKDRLVGPNSRLIVNRTLQDGSNHATMFRLTGANRFEAEAWFGQGSEIEDTILSA